MTTLKWLVSGLIITAVGAFVYFDPPTPGRAFTKNQPATSQQDQGTGANHKRTSDSFSW